LTEKKLGIAFKLLSIFLFIFGVATLKSGSAVLFFDDAAKKASGNYVPFVLWANFLAGFFYIIAAIGIYHQRSWSAKLSKTIAFFTVGLFFAFGIHILTGGLYEPRTVFAMILRCLVWIVSSALLLKFGKF
jgi:hypothetical protein